MKTWIVQECYYDSGKASFSHFSTETPEQFPNKEVTCNCDIYYTKFVSDKKALSYIRKCRENY